MVSSSDGGPRDNLSRYRAKRSPDTTTEPFGTVAGESGRLFVVHKHAARQLHFDLRLEMEGVLRSWAVPRGPSYDTNDKRLAVHVEDHPLEYGDFEGVIPAGNYGAGGVIVWDRGEWIDLEDWRTGFEKGKLLFELRGHKLRGRWTLVKIKKGERDWLLIKERDEWARSPGTDFPEESVLSGLTVEEVKEGRGPAVALRRALEEAKAPRDRVDLATVHAMQAEPADAAFTRDGWVFELKLDGYRLLAGKSHGEVTLLTRKGNDYTGVFPEVARAIRALPFDDIIIDGEVVVLDDKGMPNFARLQKRGRMSSPIEIRHATVEYPATFYAFDLLAFEDFDVRPLPLSTRKALLLEAMPRVGIVRGLDHIEREGERFLAQVRELGLEGLIAKKADAPYRGGRTDLWLKIKTEKTADFVIVGFTAPKRGRSGFGALQLADWVGGRLTYAGRAGTGFNDRLLGELRSVLDELVRDAPPCEGPTMEPGAEPLPASAIPETKTTTWVEPRLVCEVRYREWTPDGLLRHPAFLRMRDDKAPEDCERQGWLVQADEPEDAPHSGIGMGAPRDEAGDAAAEPGQGIDGASADSVPGESPARGGADVERTIAFSNLTKTYWPAEGYTKGDLIEYYRAIAPWLLPYLRDRPLVMTRFPDGIDGKSFYQKDAPEFAPSWIRTVPVWSEDTQREIRYFVCDDVESLLYVANLGSIPLHIWASRVGSLELPDWCVIDLDPKEAPFSDVIRTAQVLHRICESIGLPDFVKTTGKTGLHILLPLGRRITYAQSRTLGELLARLVLRELGDVATITRHVSRRGDKVYLDYLQNRHGQTIVAPFSVRPLPGATVSMPLVWDEVDQTLDPRDFTIRNAVERIERLGADPDRAVLETLPDLGAVLQRLAEVTAADDGAAGGDG
ncbi:MAG TPA: DNA ligase D [Gemmatimonadaceae bacterium]|nr:DNA ligase D [Gemmatimonadaceae bacterium]